MEAAVPAAEVELHHKGSAKHPPAHQSLQLLDCDSDGDSKDEDNPNDGTGATLEYFLRRMEEAGKVHRCNPRNLGDYEDEGEEEAAAFRLLMLIA
mmetsp:Transcript_12093/g.26472  ORF Transcript_12093/g.26472 Transcript_12093/m.26472 type:complete len:95 (-) Transcript_12093:1101-1385(-)